MSGSQIPSEDEVDLATVFPSLLDGFNAFQAVCGNDPSSGLVVSPNFAVQARSHEEVMKLLHYFNKKVNDLDTAVTAEQNRALP